MNVIRRCIYMNQESFNRLVEEFLKEYKIEKSTACNLITSFGEAFDFRIELPDREAVCEFYRKTKYSANYLLAYNALLRNFYRFCMEQGACEHNPAQEISRQEIEQCSGSPKKLLTQEEVVRICEQERNSYMALIYYGLFKGLSLKELIAVRQADVSPQSRILHIDGRENPQYVMDERLHEYFLKTGAERSWYRFSGVTGQLQELPLSEDSEYVIRFPECYSTPTEAEKLLRLTQRVKKHAGTKLLYQSGLFHELRGLLEKYGVQQVNSLPKEELKRVKEQYNYTNARSLNVFYRTYGKEALPVMP